MTAKEEIKAVKAHELFALIDYESTGTIFPATFIGARNSSGTVLVSRWGRSDLKPGDWGMPDGATRTNYILSGKWQPGCGNEYASFETGQTYSVPAHTVCLPNFRSIVDNPILKGPFNQRIYDPTQLQPIYGSFNAPSIFLIAPNVPLRDIDIKDIELIITTPNE